MDEEDWDYYDQDDRSYLDDLDDASLEAWLADDS